MPSKTNAKQQPRAIQLTDRDFDVLQLIAEQLTITQPQLARLIGRTEHTARWLRTRWQRAGLVESRVLLVGEPVFIWLTPKGLRTLGSDFKPWRPDAVGLLAHLRAVTDVRLDLDERYPKGAWVSERLVRGGLARSGRRVEHVPDAELWVGDRCVAIEVERTQKERLRTEEIAAHLSYRYEAVWYFAPPGVRGHLERVIERARLKGIEVYDLPSTATHRRRSART